MAQPPERRILPDLSSSGFLSDAERQRLEGIAGPSPSEERAGEFQARLNRLRETPEGKAELQATEQFSYWENQAAEEEREQREFRLRNGIPPSIEPRSIHSKVLDPPWKRKLRP